MRIKLCQYSNPLAYLTTTHPFYTFFLLSHFNIFFWLQFHFKFLIQKKYYFFLGQNQQVLHVAIGWERNGNKTLYWNFFIKGFQLNAGAAGVTSGHTPSLSHDPTIQVLSHTTSYWNLGPPRLGYATEVVRRTWENLVPTISIKFIRDCTSVNIIAIWGYCCIFLRFFFFSGV